MIEYTMIVGDRCAVVQQCGKATATTSDVEYDASGSIRLTNPKRWLSAFDAASDAIQRGDHEFTRARYGEPLETTHVWLANT